MIKRMYINLLILLILQFFAGMTLNIFVKLPDTHPGSTGDNYFLRAWQGTGWAIGHGGFFLALHVLIAIILIAASIFTIIFVFKNHLPKYLKVTSVVGFIGLLGAAFNGTSFINYGHEFSSMIMALGYMIALVSFGSGLYLSKNN